MFATLSSSYDITNVIIEGGAETIRRALDAALVDELWVFKSQATTNCSEYINMNDVIEQLDIECVSEQSSGTDTEYRYLING